jgi:ATP-dependent helicase/DNAse subunit B
LRARRVRALFLCGLVEQQFPKTPRPDPLLSDEDRLAINTAAGLRLELGRDHLARERYLLYAAVSRPTDLLVLSWRTADDEGDPAVRSLFVDDVADRFSDAPLERVRRRPLGAVDHLPGTVAAQPIGPLSSVPDDMKFSASAIEAWASCPVKWFVERLLRPQEMVPDPEGIVRGLVAHAVLKEVIEAEPLTPATLPAARERMHDALERQVAAQPISVNPERLRSEARRLEADLVRYLERAARDESAFVPRHFEEKFDVSLGPFEIFGQIDRIDVRDGELVLVDYKGKTVTPVARWIKDGKLQLGLYALAVRAAGLGEPVGALYEPLGLEDGTPRGAIVEGADPGREVKRTDVMSREEFDAILADVLTEAERAVEELRAGRLEPRPETCGWKGGGCTYPTICRCE